eukprot:1439495-Pleurochrysis_carterae.AAC.1
MEDADGARLPSSRAISTRSRRDLRADLCIRASVCALFAAVRARCALERAASLCLLVACVPRVHPVRCCTHLCVRACVRACSCVPACVRAC